LLNYIQRCDDLDKEKKRKQLTQITTLQRKCLEQKTAQLELNRIEEKKRTAEEKRRKLKEVLHS
jgi:hypothetical protein